MNDWTREQVVWDDSCSAARSEALVWQAEARNRPGVEPSQDDVDRPRLDELAHRCPGAKVAGALLNITGLAPVATDPDSPTTASSAPLRTVTEMWLHFRLFLERLTLLSIKSGSTEEERCLTRQVAPGGDGTGSTTVVLDGAHEFLLFTSQVPQELLKAALQDSVEEGALDERWLEWDAEAHVSVAVGRGGEGPGRHRR